MAVALTTADACAAAGLTRALLQPPLPVLAWPARFAVVCTAAWFNPRYLQSQPSLVLTLILTSDFDFDFWFSAGGTKWRGS